jgi:hypothetical protein
MGVLLGVAVLYFQVQKTREHRLLKAAGQHISGTLQMVTKHRTNFITTGYDLTVDYAGRRKSFSVDSDLATKHTLVDGRFTRHPVDVVYLPNRPEIAELPEMLAASDWPSYLIGIVFTLSGVTGIRPTIRAWRLSKRATNLQTQVPA